MKRLISPALALALALVTHTAAAQLTVYEKKDPDDPDAVRRLQLFGFLQPRFFYQQKDPPSRGNNVDIPPTFVFRRARLGAIGQPTKMVLLQTELELATAAVVGIDAFARFTPHPAAQLTVGQFRVPFSRQNLVQGFAHQAPDPAFFVDGKFIQDRDIGAQAGGEVLDGRVVYAAAVMNGNGPRIENLDDYFLFAGRLEVAPLGRFPRFEGDLRSDEERKQPLFYVGGGAMSNRITEKRYRQLWVGADGSFIWHGFSLYAELFYKQDRPEDAAAEAAGVTKVTAQGFNVQAGYVPPLPYAEEHFELIARFHQLDPNKEVKEPPPRDNLALSNPVQGFQGIGFGLNWFAERSHAGKLQAYYEIRNELKKCLQGQRNAQAAAPEAACTGYVKNDVFMLQATASFLSNQGASWSHNRSRSPPERCSRCLLLSPSPHRPVRIRAAPPRQNRRRAPR